MKNIQGFDNYAVTKEGKIWSYKTNKWLSQHDNGWGYMYVLFYNKGKKVNQKVHRIVAKAFLDNPEEKREVNHKDGNKQNNQSSNLEWVTRSENIKHKYKHGPFKILDVNNYLVHIKAQEKELINFQEYIKKTGQSKSAWYTKAVKNYLKSHS